MTMAAGSIAVVTVTVVAVLVVAVAVAIVTAIFVQSCGRYGCANINYKTNKSIAAHSCVGGFLEQGRTC